MPTAEADVIVVGAGPGGSATAYWLAQAGLDVLLIEKATFPRDKVCGDGFTPRGVKPLIDMGIDTGPGAGWIRHRGLRVYGGGHRLELDWPELASYPNYGLVRPRLDFDELLARHAQKAGAHLLEGTRVDGAVLDRAGRVVGVDGRGEGGNPVSYRAQLVIDAGGMSGTVGKSLGLARRTDRPMGVAVRRYFTSPRTNDEYIESWLELRDGERLLPGYGWIF
ncbi:MAG: FAD-dependent oxidoreductase, partial [Geodermatophilaceae bacterium]|nr:FAD-dependent oxidoreductase [Geodermatophilaceae bacterium]